MNARTAENTLCQQILADLKEPVPMAPSEFNDDSIYVYDVLSKCLVREIGSKDSEAIDSRYIGLRVAAGETWAKGMTAKYAGIWRGAYRFQKTSCSNCGNDFGPGDHGFSHCENHTGRKAI